MKKLLAFIFLLSSFMHAQYSIKGTMTPTVKTDWVILYKIEGTKQNFIKNTKIKIDSTLVNGKNQAVGNFEFILPEKSKTGTYRVSYKLNEVDFVDFLFNKDVISFTFIPSYLQQSLVFSKSEENKIYQDYLKAMTATQNKLDSIQIAFINNPKLEIGESYEKKLVKISNIQDFYLKKSSNMMVQTFIKATLRKNLNNPTNSSKEFMDNIINTYFDTIDFSNKHLLNSSFLVNKINEYIFYLNTSEDEEMQFTLHKTAVNIVISKIKDSLYKKSTLEFLVSQFESIKNVKMVDYIFENQYNKLPEELQNLKFKEEKIAALLAEVGRTAPDFSWKENGITQKLSTLKTGENYILVFWSTSCSHCLKEIPQLYEATKGNTKTKVIAFAMEDENTKWYELKVGLKNWHHIFGIGKWENKTARTYQINSTPSYFILDANKKIIAKPISLKDAKKFIIKE
jgi:thiol-disulfide isomerase/thioredoxin